MAKLYGNPIPHPDKPHVVYLMLEKDSGERVEVLARKAKYDSLTTVTKRLTYALECAEYHSADGPGWSLKRQNRRALWDADDKVVAEAAAAAAKAAEEAVFDMKQQGFVKNQDGQIVGVNVAIKWQGFTCTATIPNDPANAVVNGKSAWQKAKDAYDAEQAALAAFNVQV